MTFLFVQASEAATVFVNEIPFMLIFYQFSPFNHRESMKHVSRNLSHYHHPLTLLTSQAVLISVTNLPNLYLDSLFNSTLERINTIVHADHRIVTLLPIERSAVRPDPPQ